MTNGSPCAYHVRYAFLVHGSGCIHHASQLVSAQYRMVLYTTASYPPGVHTRSKQWVSREIVVAPWNNPALLHLYLNPLYKHERIRPFDA